MRYAYTGEVVPSYIPTETYEGFTDARRTSTKNEKRLYRHPYWKHLLWKIGNIIGRLV